MVRLHELMAGEKFPNCSRLAREFEVSTKTIQRDVEFMRDQLTLPIAYDKTRHGFHYTHPVSQFPLITVSEGELVALLVAQKAVEQYRGTSFEKPLHAAFEKLVSSLGNETTISLQEISEAVSFRSAGVPRGEIETFEVLADAAMTAHGVTFSYRSLQSERTEQRRVDPYHLACISNQWYLIGHDHGRGGVRTFALPRIRHAARTEARFQRPRDFSASEMLAGSFSAFEAGETKTIRLRFRGRAARLVSERQWHKSQVIRTGPAGTIELTMRVGLAPDLESWILGWGGSAEVVEPAALREKIAAAARDLAAIYGPSTSNNNHATAGLPGPGADPDRDQAVPHGEIHRGNRPGAVSGSHSRKRPVHLPVRGSLDNEPVLLFVTVCTKDRKPILANNAAHDLILAAWEKATSWRVGRYVIMPDHIHLFCAPTDLPPRPLGQWIRFWKAEISRRWPDRTHQPIWQAEFWDTQLRRGDQYAAKWRYVRENPVRAGLSTVTDAWPWQGEVAELPW